MVNTGIAMGPIPDPAVPPPKPKTGPAQPAEYRRLIQTKSNRVGYLHRLPIAANETDRSVMENLIRTFAARKVWQILNLVFLFRVQAIYIGSLIEAPNAALEAQFDHFPVQFVISGLDPLLTEAFRDIKVLGIRDDLLANTTRFKTSGANMETLVIKYKHTKSHMAWCAVFLALVSVAIGVLVGLLTHRADLGVRVTSGVGTLLTVVEAIIIWQSR